MPRITPSLALLTAVAALLPAASADAAKTERVLVDRFTEPYENAFDCSTIGPYDFVNEFSGIQRVRVVDVVAADGTVLRTELIIGLREIDTNAATGASLALRASVREIWDYGTNTRTLSGAVWIGTEPGDGTYVHDAGRITMTLDTRIASFLAGPKEAFFSDAGVDTPVCAALAAA
jgi:hypothetical protein